MNSGRASTLSGPPDHDRAVQDRGAGGRRNRPRHRAESAHDLPHPGGRPAHRRDPKGHGSIGIVGGLTYDWPFKFMSSIRAFPPDPSRRSTR
jgi:hypothetical protein